MNDAVAASKSRRRPWPLNRVVAAHRSAPLIWLALLELSVQAGGLIVTPTRQQLAEISGVQRVQTVSRALTTLESAGWIRRKIKPVFNDDGVQVATLLRIRLRRRVHAKTPSVDNTKRCSKQQFPRCEQRKTVADSHRECAHTPPLRGGGALADGEQHGCPRKPAELAPLNTEGLPVAVAEMQARLRGLHNQKQEEA